MAGSASASVWTFDLRPGTTPGNYGVNHSGGRVNFIKGLFDTVNQRFRYEVNMGNSSAGSLPDGFWLAMNDGPNPKGVAGELALFYFDSGVTNNGTAKLTVYGYNGFNGDTSYKDGSPADGVQAPDRIVSSMADHSWINELRVTNESNGTRTMVMDIDAALINNRAPLYPDSVAAWEGVGFRSKYGIWFHQVDGLSATYGADGFLTNWSWSKQGWVDGENLTAVPEPATMTVLAAAGLMAAARRRKKA